MSEVKIGTHFLCVSPLLGVVQIVAPADNTAGIIIRTSCIAAANGTVNLVAGTSAPTSVSDLSKAIIFSGNGNSAAGSNAEVLMPYPLLIPAGQGLWATARTTGTSAISLTWDLQA